MTPYSYADLIRKICDTGYIDKDEDWDVIVRIDGEEYGIIDLWRRGDKKIVIELNKEKEDGRVRSNRK